MSLSIIPPANPALLPSRERYIDLFHFHRWHPFVVSDGRRFCSLEAAAATAADMDRTTTVTDETGRLYTWEDCRAIACRDRRMAS